MDAEIDVQLASMSDEQRADPRFFPDNYEAWREFFRQRYERELAAYDSPRDYFVTRVAEGVATLAAAFAPEPVIVRMSDFKSNEYANLVGV